MKKFLSLVCAVFMTVLTFGQSYGILVNGKTYFAGEPAGVNEGFTQYLAHVSVKAGDYCQLYDAENKAAWVVTLNSWSVEGFALNNDRYEVTVDGCYDFYIKLKYEQDELYIGNGSNCSEGVDITGGGEEAQMDTIYTWYGKRGESSATEAVEAGGTAAAYGGNSNIVVGTAQKTNWTIKLNKGFSNANFVGITLDKALEAGDKLQVAAFRTSTSDAVFGIDFSADAESAATTCKVLFPNNLQQITTNVAPEDTTFTIPECAAGAKFIRIYRNSGSTGVYVANFTVLREKAGDTPEPPVEDPAKFYITGDAALLGELAWNPAAIKVTEDSYTFENLAAGDYKLKVTVDGTWGTAKGFSDLTTTADGLTADADGNICFTLAEAGNVSVHYDGEYFFLNGNFYVVPVVSADYYMKNGWDGGDWTWKAMTLNEGTYFLEKVVVSGNGVNLNNAATDEGASWIEWNQIETYDMSYEAATISALDTVVFMFDPEAVNQYTGANGLSAVILGKYTEPETPPTPSVIYSVAGSKALLGAEWNEKEGNEMTLDTEDGLYKLLCADVTLAAGVTYEFKIVTNHNWNNPNYPAANKVLLVDKDGKYDVTITFNAETKEVAYVAEFKGGVIVEKHYLIVGDAAIANGEDWNNDADVNLMTSADEGLTYTLVISNVKMIANMEYGYKVVEKGSWTEYFPNKVSGGNEYFSVTESAVYTLTYTFTVATSQCVVLASKTGELPEPKLKDGFYLAGSFAGVDAWTIDDLNENKLFKYVEGDENYALYTLTANLAVGDKFKVVSVAQDVIMYWLPDGQGNEIVVTANYAGEAKVINLYFDYKEGRFSIWIEPNIQDGFYLVGSMNNWTPAKEYLFAQNPDNTAEYVLSTTLAENDQFKVVYVYEGEIQNDQWYPAADNSDYTVDALHAGKKDIYFRPDYQGGEDWYYGCIYVAANESTGIEETIAAGKAAKVLRNGQIFIIKGDKMYNVMGAVIR